MVRSAQSNEIVGGITPTATYGYAVMSVQPTSFSAPGPVFVLEGTLSSISPSHRMLNRFGDGPSPRKHRSWFHLP